MGSLPGWKKQKAFRMRLEEKTFAEVARECHLAPQTVQRLENGWIDKKGVKHPGWKDKLERMLREREEAELQSGLTLRKERIKAYRELAEQAREKIRAQFPNIAMKNSSDYKAIMSEFRELCRLIDHEVGSMEGGEGGLKADVTPDEVEAAYAAARDDGDGDVIPPRDARAQAGLPEPDIEVTEDE